MKPQATRPRVDPVVAAEPNYETGHRPPPTRHIANHVQHPNAVEIVMGVAQHKTETVARGAHRAATYDAARPSLSPESPYRFEQMSAVSPP